MARSATGGRWESSCELLRLLPSHEWHAGRRAEALSFLLDAQRACFLFSLRVSVCVCRYECLVGYPPFYAEDPMSTCRKIVNWKKTLVFPEEAKLSADSKDLIQRMVCDSSKRLTFDQLKTHRFFAGLDWSNVRKTKSPIIPSVTNELDTQNFDKFEDLLADEALAAEEAAALGAAGADNSFIGYTFKRVEQPKMAADMFGQFLQADGEKRGRRGSRLGSIVVLSHSLCLLCAV